MSFFTNDDTISEALINKVNLVLAFIQMAGTLVLLDCS